jgi:hypothetical protein
MVGPVIKIASFDGHSQLGASPPFDLRMDTDPFYKCSVVFRMLYNGQSPEIV